MILLFYGSLLFILTRMFYTLGKHNSGKMKCHGIVGRLLAHRFVEYYNERVCSVCGLVQKEGPAGMLRGDGDTWYDEGYAENKETLIRHYLDQKRIQSEKNRKWSEDRQTAIANNKILTPRVQRVATKEDET